MKKPKPVDIEDVFNAIHRLVTQCDSVRAMRANRPKVAINSKSELGEKGQQLLAFIQDNAQACVFDMLDDPVVTGFCTRHKLTCKKNADFGGTIAFKNIEITI